MAWHKHLRWNLWTHGCSGNWKLWMIQVSVAWGAFQFKFISIPLFQDLFGSQIFPSLEAAMPNMSRLPGRPKKPFPLHRSASRYGMNSIL